MGSLPQFYTPDQDDDTGKRYQEERKKRQEVLIHQQNLTLEQKKGLFNSLSLEDKKKCLLSLEKREPLTPVQLEGTWWGNGGKEISSEEIGKLKKQSSLFSRPGKYYCWKRTSDRLLLREYDSNFSETGKSYASTTEKNDLAILVKGEKFLRSYGLITFDFLRNKGK